MKLEDVIEMVPEGYKLAIVFDHTQDKDKRWVEFRLLRGVKQAIWKVNPELFNQVDERILELHMEEHLGKAIRHIDEWYESRKGI